MPGQLEMIAQQLGMGFGQQPGDIMAYLQQFNKPVQIAPMPAASASKPTSAGGTNGQHHVFFGPDNTRGG
jgi:hypothetical protein